MTCQSTQYKQVIEDAKLPFNLPSTLLKGTVSSVRSDFGPSSTQYSQNFKRVKNLIKKSIDLELAS